MVTMVHVEVKISTFWPSTSLENVFPAFQRKANSSCKNVKVKVTLLKNVSKVVHFIDYFLRECILS